MIYRIADALGGGVKDIFPFNYFSKVKEKGCEAVLAVPEVAETI